MRLELVPTTLEEANAFVEQHHRHRGPVVGAKFSIAAAALIGPEPEQAWPEVVGVTPHVCSMLYAAAWRAARALGYAKLITYTLKSEPGTSLRAAGWKVVGEVKGRSWSCQSRPRVDTAPHQDKLRWEPA